MADYPPEPWDLRGQLHASAFLVPLRELRALLGELPPGWRPLRIGRRGVVGTAWVVYEPGGVLSYRELMATVLARRGRRVLPCVVRIWVDDESSLAGGRALWGIPKELAHFEVVDFNGPATTIDGTEFTAGDATGPIADATVRARARLPGRWPLSFSVVQTLDGGVKVSPVRTRAAIRLSGARFAAAPSGPLRMLTGRRPFVSFSLRDFRMTFGHADVRTS